jgi:hypothetical protein
MHISGKYFIAVLVSTLIITGSTIPASHANPIPGRFCKSSDIDKKVVTAKYGLMKCKKDGSSARWKAIKSRNLG